MRSQIASDELGVEFDSVDGKDNENLRFSIRNMKSNNYLPPEGVNVYDVLRHDHLVVSKDAAKALEARLLEQKS